MPHKIGLLCSITGGGRIFQSALYPQKKVSCVSADNRKGIQFWQYFCRIRASLCLFWSGNGDSFLRAVIFVFYKIGNALNKAPCQNFQNFGARNQTKEALNDSIWCLTCRHCCGTCCRKRRPTGRRSRGPGKSRLEWPRRPTPVQEICSTFNVCKHQQVMLLYFKSLLLLIFTSTTTATFNYFIFLIFNFLIF